MNDFINDDIEKLSLNEDSQQIIIKLDPEEKFFFEHNTYNPLLLSEIISRKKYDQIIFGAEKILCEATVKKEKYERIYINKIIYMLCLFILILFTIYFLLLYFSIRKNNGKKYIKIGIILALIGLLLIICLFFYNIMRKHTLGKATEEFIIEYLDNYCSNINKNINERIKFFYNKFNRTLVCDILINKINYDGYNQNQISINTFNENSIDNNYYITENLQTNTKILSTQRNLIIDNNEQTDNHLIVKNNKNNSKKKKD